MEHSDESTTIQNLKEVVSKFVEDREWQKFHTPRNLAESLSLEAAELLEIFQWTSEIGEPVRHDNRIKTRLEEELADILIYSISLANVARIDVAKAFFRKMKKNALKYPTRRYKGTYSKPGE